MRLRRTWFALASALLAGAGCSWSAFDDLADQTWVDSAGPAEGVDPNDFLGVAAPGATDRNAVFVVLGKSTDSVGSYSYDADGARATVGAEIRANSTQFGILDVVTPLAADPYSNAVGVAGVTNEAGNGDTKVVSFSADTVAVISQNDFNSPNSPLDGSIQPTGMVYARTDDDGVGTTTTDIALARGNQVALIQDYANQAHTIVGCIAEDPEDVVLSIAAGPFVGTDADPDDELIMVVNDSAGTLPTIVIFDGSVVPAAFGPPTAGTLQDCFDGSTRIPIARIDGPAGDPEFGRRLIVGDFDGDADPDWVIASPANNQVTAYINDGTLADGVPTMVVQAPFEASQFGFSLAAGDLDGDGADELVVGAPAEDIGDATNAGAVHVYQLTGSAFELAMTVHDAQPETEQRIGTAVEVVPWGGARNILVAVGDTEVFTYFRTLLYDDVRNGR